ncbi:hypothetical protein LOZ58_006273 [Ophidiomyces ophidiicola]|nr:hypothetical protein LOZ58_006273 [Ophidiomyces ophidiicola]
MASSRYNVSAPRLPTEIDSSRIKINSLLNPNGDDEVYPRCSSGSWPAAAYHHHYHPYQQRALPRYPPTNYPQIPYPSNTLPPIDVYCEPLGRGYTSASTSPRPNHRERFPSVSSGSSTTAERRRPPRPKYEEEEMYFIWYHRVDLRQEWKQVRESFNTQFPDRQRNGFQGIQCKYYRFIKEKKCPTLREQRRQRNGESGGPRQPHDDSPIYGVIRWCNVWFPWMKETQTDEQHLGELQR